MARKGRAMSETRKIAAILVADVVGYSRLAGADEGRTLSRLRGLRSDLIIAAHHGRIVKRTGDGSIIESAAWSTRCAAPSKCRADIGGGNPAIIVFTLKP
jgi:adenylate cyclase